MRRIMLVIVFLTVGLSSVAGGRDSQQGAQPLTRTLIIAGRLFDSESGTLASHQRILVNGRKG